MARTRLKAALLTTIICVAPTSFAGDVPASGAKQAPAVFSTLHHLDWNRVRPEDLERLTGLSYKRETLRSPDETEACSGTTYLTARTARGGLLTIEFSSSKDGDRCRLSLSAIIFFTTMPHTDAQLERSAFVIQLKPGGTDGCDNEISEYSWRSLNSRVRFDLGIAVKPQAVEADPSTPTKLTVRLTHENVEPASVDHLPFEKGVFMGASLTTSSLNSKPKLSGRASVRVRLRAVNVSCVGGNPAAGRQN
jgi:hypothetical protein